MKSTSQHMSLKLHLENLQSTFQILMVHSFHTNLLPNTRTFDNMRKVLGLETKEKAVLRKLSKTQDGKAHIHGYKTQRLESVLDTSALLDEAKTWGSTEKINWTAVAR